MDLAIAAAPRPKGDVNALVRLAESDMAAVDALILDRMQSDVPIIPKLAEHLVSAGGKRLRPLLTVAAARATGATDDILSPRKLAAAVEFIHTATLLHDDIVDASELRRGKVAAHLIWGAPTSVLVGDFLFARAFELMVETDSMRALGILAEASRVISEGEVLQLTRAHDLNLDQATYLQIISAKTAELFAAAAEAGAVGAAASAEAVKALRDYGMALGVAFQLADDALDYGATAEALGKNAGDDFNEGKATLPLLLAVARTKGREDAFWERTVTKGERTPEDFARARELVIGSGAIGATLDLAGDYADQAKAALAVLPASDWRVALENLADFAVSRAALMAGSDTLDAQVRAADLDRWLSSRLVSDPQARADLIALYAFEAELMVIPTRVTQPLLAEMRYTWWAEQMDGVCAGVARKGHPVLEALTDVVARHSLDRAPFDALIEAHIGRVHGQPHDLEAFYVGPMQAAVQVLAGPGHADAVVGTGRVWGLTQVGRADEARAARKGANAELKRLPISGFPAVAHAALSGRDRPEAYRRLQLIRAAFIGRI